MPTVPRLDLTGTVPGALPGVRQTSVASPELFGAAGAKDVAFGEALGRATDPLAKIALEEAEKNAVAKVQEARNELGNRTLDFITKAKTEETGPLAAGATTRFRDWHAKQVEEISKNLTGEDQKRAFTQAAGQHALASRGEVGTFELAETRKYQDATFKSTVDNKINEGANAVTAFAYDTAKKELLQNFEAFAATRKFDDAQRADYQRNLLTEFHARRIGILASQRPLEALAYFKANSAEIDVKERPELEARAKKAGDEQAGLDSVTTLMETMGPKGPMDAFKYDEMDTKLREQFKDNPAALRLARAELAHRAQYFNAEQKQVTDKAASTVLDAYNKGMPPSQLRKLPEWQSTSPAWQLEFNKMQESVAASRESRAAAAESRAYTREQRAESALVKDQRANTWRMMDPSFLVTMTDNEVLALQPKIGLANVEDLMRSKRALAAGGDKLKEAQVDHDMFVASAIKAGVLPLDNTKSTPEQKDRAALLKSEVERLINAEQSVTKKPVPPERKQQIINQAVDNKVLEEHWYGNKERIMGTLDDKETLNIMPKVERAFVERVLKAGNVQPTERAIADQWRFLKSRPGGFPSLATPGSSPMADKIPK